MFRAGWWREPALIPEWGVLVHCAQGHFRWFEAELDEGETAAAEARFALVGQESPASF